MLHHILHDQLSLNGELEDFTAIIRTKETYDEPALTALRCCHQQSCQLGFLWIWVALMTVFHPCHLLCWSFLYSWIITIHFWLKMVRTIIYIIAIYWTSETECSLLYIFPSVPVSRDYNIFICSRYSAGPVHSVTFKTKKIYVQFLVILNCSFCNHPNCR